MVGKISAVTFRVANMRASVRFYKDVLGLEIIYGGEGSYFTSLCTKGGDAILNLEHGDVGSRWGRLIFHVSDVDRFWAYLMRLGRPASLDPAALVHFLCGQGFSPPRGRVSGRFLKGHWEVCSAGKSSSRIRGTNPWLVPDSKGSRLYKARSFRTGYQDCLL